MRRLILAWLMVALVAALVIPASVASLPPSSPTPNVKVYIVSIENVRDRMWHFTKELMEHLSRLGFDWCIIKTLDDWKALLENPPDNVIVINCHYECLPCPYPEYLTSTDKALEFIKMLATIVKEHGWTFFGGGGYPFYRVADASTTQEVGDAGLRAFLSVVGAAGDCWADRGGLKKAAPGVLTDEFKGWLEEHGFRVPDEIPEKLWCGRAISTDAPCVTVIYRTDPELGCDWNGYPQPFIPAGIFKVGKGYYAHVGYHDGGWEDRFADYGYFKPDGGNAEYSKKLGYLAAAIALYIREKYIPNGQIYIFYDPNKGASWVNRDAFFDAVKSKLDELGVPYTVVDSNGLENLLRYAEARNIIMINCHGECVPPGDWLRNLPWGGGDKAMWWFHWIGYAIAELGWAWINPAGYPFWDAWGVWCVGDNGLQQVLSVAGYGGYCGYGDSDYRVTMGAVTVAGWWMLKLQRWWGWDVWPYVRAPRAIKTDLKLIFAMYVAEPMWEPGVKRYAMAAFEFGKGVFIHCGMAHEGEHARAHALCGLLAYLYHPLVSWYREFVEEQWEEAYNTLFEAYSAVKAENERLLAELESMMKEHARLSAEYSALLERLKARSEEVSALKAELVKVKSALTTYEKRTEHIKSLISQLEQRKSELESQISTLQSEVESLRSEAEAARTAAAAKAKRLVYTSAAAYIIVAAIGLALGLLIAGRRRP